MFCFVLFCFVFVTFINQIKSTQTHFLSFPDVAGVVHISCSGLINEIDDVYSIIDSYDKMGVCVGVHPSYAWRYVDGHPDSRNKLIAGEITVSCSFFFIFFVLFLSIFPSSLPYLVSYSSSKPL